MIILHRNHSYVDGALCCYCGVLAIGVRWLSRPDVIVDRMAVWRYYNVGFHWPWD
jgi:hypothetical protein